MLDTTTHTPPQNTAPNTRRPWHRRTATRSALVVMLGAVLLAFDAYAARTAPDDLSAYAYAALCLVAGGLVARGCYDVRPCYKRPDPETSAARMDD